MLEPIGGGAWAHRPRRTGRRTCNKVSLTYNAGEVRRASIPRLHRLGAAVVTVGLLTLVGCTTDERAQGAASGASDEDRQEQAAILDEQCEDMVIPELPDLQPVEPAEGTATVSTQFGDRELPTDPAAALGMYTTDLDMLIWLRYPLAKSQPIRTDFGYKTFPCFFPSEQLTGIGTFDNYPDYDFESVLAAQPDFILNGLGYDKKTVTRLDEIAPTYSVDAFDGQSWMVHFEETAEALGRSDYYQDWKDLYDERVAEVAERIGDPSSVTVAPVGYWEGKLQTGCYSGVECQVFDDLGLQIDPSSLSNDRQGESLSGEQVGKLDQVDWAFMIKAIGETGQKQFDQTQAEAAKNPLWAKLPFVTEDQVVPYEAEITYGSPSGQLAFLDVVEKALAP